MTCKSLGDVAAEPCDHAPRSLVAVRHKEKRAMATSRPAGSPSPNCLRVLDELINSRDDESRNCVYAKLQNIIHRDVGKLYRQRRFVERHKRIDDASHHRNGIGKLIGGVERRLDFCAVVQWGEVITVDSGRPNVFKLVSLRIDDVEMSVFVNVCELLQPSQLQRPTPLVVRSQCLNECKSLYDNPRQRLCEEIKRKR
jgi:hypothetical protein